eukprot:6688239-Alexandrium_andersonii.AAC.1
MSASLVGSEMCIRDRGLFGDTVVFNHWCLPTLLQAMLCALSNARAPVSYTHLTLPTICSV